MKRTSRRRVWVKGPAMECPLNAVRHLTVTERIKDLQINNSLQAHRMGFHHRKAALSGEMLEIC